jgi:peptidoglycan hydrolase-like protein with peptidoglycan-binding domain
MMKSGRAARGGGNAEQVKAVQQALKDKGHDPGDVDGKMGPKTQAALRDYQQKEGLKATGRLDTETAAKLGVQTKADAGSAGSPAASPSGSPSSSSSSGSSAPSGSSSSGGASGSSTGAKTK